MFADVVGLLGALGILGGSSFALAQVPESSGLSDPNCIVAAAEADESCVLRVSYRTLGFVAGSEQSLFLVLKNQDLTETIAVHDDLSRRVESGEFTTDEASLIVADVDQLEGAFYDLPEFRTLKNELGFPLETRFEIEDFRELVRTHLQISIGVGPLTAAYLSDRMGVRYTEEEGRTVVPAPVLVAPPATESAAEPETTPTDKSVDKSADEPIDGPSLEPSTEPSTFDEQPLVLPPNIVLAATIVQGRF